MNIEYESHLLREYNVLFEALLKLPSDIFRWRKLFHEIKKRCGVHFINLRGKKQCEFKKWNEVVLYHFDFFQS